VASIRGEREEEREMVEGAKKGKEKGVGGSLKKWPAAGRWSGKKPGRGLVPVRVFGWVGIGPDGGLLLG
jgi:hypothetical protein